MLTGQSGASSDLRSPLRSGEQNASSTFSELLDVRHVLAEN